MIRGWTICESCHRGEAIPIGFVITRGGQKGKEVYLASSVRRELHQDALGAEMKEDLDEELGDKEYLVIEDEF